MTLPELECACANVRRASRLVTQLYGREMGNRIEPSQFSLLSVLSKKPGCAQAWMGAYLGLDKTSLSRNLGLMQKNGWIEPAVSEDRRERGYRLTAEGERVLDEAKQGWARAQAKLRAAMDEDDWAAMQRVFERVARAAVEAR